MKSARPTWKVVDHKTFWHTVFNDGPAVLWGLPHACFIPGPAGYDPTPPPPKDGDSPFIGREQVAQMLGCCPDTVSRRRKRLEAEGVVGMRIEGRSLRWRRDAVLAYVDRRGLTGKRGRGRPRKQP